MILHAIIANPQLVNINYDIIKQIIYILSFVSFFTSWVIITLFVIYAITFITMITILFKNSNICTLELIVAGCAVICLFIFWNIANIHITHNIIEEYKKIKMY